MKAIKKSQEKLGSQATMLILQDNLMQQSNPLFGTNQPGGPQPGVGAQAAGAGAGAGAGGANPLPFGGA